MFDLPLNLTANMSEEIAQLKQLQADINGAFDDLLKSSQESLNNPRVISDAKERLGTMAQKTLATLMGPAFSIITLSSQVSSHDLIQTT